MCFKLFFDCVYLDFPNSFLIKLVPFLRTLSDGNIFLLILYLPFCNATNRSINIGIASRLCIKSLCLSLVNYTTYSIRFFKKKSIDSITIIFFSQPDKYEKDSN